MIDLHQFFAEGMDIKFIKDYCTFLNLNITRELHVETEGWTKLPFVANKFLEATNKGGVNIVIFDADDDATKRREELFAKQQELNINFELFLFPNNNDAGMAENLLLQLVKPKYNEVLICFDDYCKCITDCDQGNRSSQNLTQHIVKKTNVANMEKGYQRITLDERIIIEKQLASGVNHSQIAIGLCRAKSSVYRDIKLCKHGLYSAIEATRLSVGNSSDRKNGKSKMNQNEELFNYVKKKLDLFWSPQQIHMNLKKDYPANEAMRIAVETIYFYIYVHAKPELKAALIEQLRQKRKYRGNVRRGKDKRTTIADKISIEERPEEVKGRLIPGHWEGDLIMGKDRQSAIGTINERTTRTLILVHLKARDAESVRKAFQKEFKTVPAQMKKTMTYDNGTEMAQHKLFTKNTKIAVYFAHPYSPWERPTNENSNGLLRDYFPKGTDLSLISKKRLKEVQNQLNERPREVLNWRTPKEVFDEFIMTKTDMVQLPVAAR